MNMKKINKFLLVTFATAGLLTGCEDLDVVNENDPNFSQVVSSPEDVETVAGSLYNTIFEGEHLASGVEPMLATAADHVTCSWGNFAMRDMSFEPRNNAWNNAPTYSNQGYNKYSYDKWYSAIGSATDVMTAINGGMVIITNGVDNTTRTKAFAKFAFGLAYGNLALVYDKAHVVDDVKSAEGTLEAALPYEEVAAAAIAYLEEALELSNTTFTIPSGWLGTANDVSNVDFKKIINTSAARILAYLPRNTAELNEVDWAKVQAYADAGITADWNVIMDGYVRWYFEAGDYLTFTGWGRTDMYVVHLMEPSLPQHWDDVASFPHPAEPADPLDNRLETDFNYLSSNDFRPDRGYYHYSCYRGSRYDEVYVAGVGPKPTVMLAENDMLRAEARARKAAPDLAGAAAIINAGTRVTRGGLAPVAANLTAIVDAIHHERHVEMFTTGMGLQFFEMRKLDLLQEGTPLHLPIPGQTLQLFGLSDYYTFGTVARADGVGTSNGGWR